ncbi:hypothetical protein BSIN_0315 [Burkholderia singularis]|uniref:Uncharacterized protein n=1 Tax=Burkholderia singularis TaxID=1503053 RepID=A0A238H4P5_9BURK|nr:hypothetical protein BSIN_0315 [Burkholderia singularis]
MKRLVEAGHRTRYEPAGSAARRPNACARRAFAREAAGHA